VVFFDNFSKDRVFAIERTQYPLVVKSSELGSDLVTTTFVSKDQDRKSLSLKKYMSNHDMKSKIMIVSKKYAEVRIGLPESDWLYFYRFVVKDGCWFLREITG
jgi:hypothetical protein